MPYTFTTVPITAAPAADIVTAIEAALTAHSAWSFVEEVTQTDVHRIWKCSGAQNIAGTDFYVALVKPSTVTTFGIKVFEGWNATTHRMHRPVPSSTGAVPVTADLTTGATDVLLTDATAAGAPLAPTKTGLSTTASHPLHIFVTKSRLVVASQVGGGGGFGFAVGAWPAQAGITDSRFKNIGLMFSTSNLATLGNTAPTGSTQNGGAFSRTTPVGSGSTWGLQVAPTSMLREGSAVSATATAVDSASGRFLVSPVGLFGPWASANNGPGYRGIWPDAICYAGVTSSGPLHGDIIVGADSTQYLTIGTAGVITGSLIALSTTLADT